MRRFILSGALNVGMALGQAIYGASGTPAFTTVPETYVAGFENPILTTSSAGHAICVEGTIPVTATAMNAKLNFKEPANQTVVTEATVEYLQINSTLASMVVTGKQNVTGTYGIYSKLCYPISAGSINSTIVQFLIHGVGFGLSYWDVAANYSYVDAAALAGYTTFSYDRLGIGMSDHPDPIEVVQAQMEVTIAHELIQSLRAGRIASTAFKHVVGVGHSFGSIQTQALTAQFPRDLDAAVLTGFSTSSAGQPIFFAGLNLAIASENSPHRFPTLSKAYLISSNIIGNQFCFFRAQNFPPANLYIAELTKQTFTIGEFFTVGSVEAVASNFTGPIDVVDGENDLPFCEGNCLLPMNQAAAVKAALYPAASEGSEYYIAAGAGHGLNLHYAAPAAYSQIMSFLKKNSL